MMRLSLSALAAAAALYGASFAISSAIAQTPPAPAAAPTQQMTSDGKPCGPVAYSPAEQKYVGIPCNAAPTQTSDGKPCGPVAYSPAEQKYVGIPCNAPSQQTSDGKPCGPVAYSPAEQKYVGIPCSTK
jgi:hypothetical protein